MQLKFITLTLSAVLAISALSANALPTGSPDTTGQDIATQPGNNDVNHGAQAADPAQKNTGALGSLSDIGNVKSVSDLSIVEGLLKEVTDDLLKGVLKLVTDLVAGDCNNKGVVEKLLQIIKGLRDDDKPGKFTDAKNGDIQEPGTSTPKNNNDDDVVSAIINLVKGLLGGKSAEESGAANVVDLLEGLLKKRSSDKNDSGAKCNSNDGTRGLDANQRDERQ